MQVLPAGTPASLTETLSAPDLFVGATIWDDSGSSPVQVTGLTGMINDVLPLLNWQGNSYRAQVPGAEGIWYLAQVAVYTDGTYTAVDPDEPQGDESFIFQSSSGGGGSVGSSCGVKGIVSDQKIVGVLKC